MEYSVGVIYLVIANLPRSERYKLENIIIFEIIPVPNEPKKHMNYFLKPMVNELLDLWEGCYIQTSSDLGIVPVRCALLCVSCYLLATRKVCGFTPYSSLRGCSKCMKSFPCEFFGKNLIIRAIIGVHGLCEQIFFTKIIFHNTMMHVQQLITTSRRESTG